MEGKHKKIAFLPLKIFALLIAFMIVIRFSYVFYDFMQTSFSEPVEEVREVVKHIMLALILLEILTITLQVIIEDIISPNLLLIIVLTALGREIIVIDFEKVEFTTLIGIGVLFGITILGLHFTKKSSKPF